MAAVIKVTVQHPDYQAECATCGRRYKSAIPAAVVAWIQMHKCRNQHPETL